MSRARLRGLPSDSGPGNAVTITVAHENVTEVFTGVGEKGVSAGSSGKRAVDEAKEYLSSDAAVGSHLRNDGAFNTLIIKAVLLGYSYRNNTIGSV